MIPHELRDMAESRKRTLQLVSDLSQAQLDFKDSEDSWSVGEILHHLILTDDIIKKDVRDLVALEQRGDETVVRRSLKEFDVSIGPIPKKLLPWATIPFTINSLLLPKRLLNYMAQARWVPFRHPMSADPKHGRPGAELREELEASHQQLAEIFEGAPDIDYSKLVHKHPLFGTNTVIEVLQFGANHEGRHQKQMVDTLGSPNFPPPEEKN